jgi:hypothetical protein
MGADPSSVDAEVLQAQLDTAEQLALVAGLPLAAQWIRDHSQHATVWVEDADGHPERMLAWVAKERGLHPITCAICEYVAIEVDHYHPYHQEWDRCAAHAHKERS